MPRPGIPLRFAAHELPSETDESTKEPEPVLPSISSGTVEGGRDAMSRDMEFSRALVVGVNALVIPPLQMLLEPHALLLPAKVVLSDPFMVLLSEGLNDRDYPRRSVWPSTLPTLRIDMSPRTVLVKAIFWAVVVAP